MAQRRIWKYEIGEEDSLGIEMPKDAKILSFQYQENTPCIWALVDHHAEKTLRRFQIVGTGEPYEWYTGHNYIQTAQQGPFVWHLFEVT